MSKLDDLIKDLEKNKILFDQKGNLQKGISKYILINAVPLVETWIKEYLKNDSIDKPPISIIFQYVKDKNPYVSKYIKYQTFRLWFLKQVEIYRKNDSNK